MVHRIRQIDIDDANEGMTLAEPILDAHNDVLLPEGTVLTDANLRSLRRRSIDYLFIINGEVSEEEMRAEQERIRKRLEHLFRKSRAGGTNAALMSCITEYRIGSM